MQTLLFSYAAISTRVYPSHPNREYKLVRARVVLRWGTTREGRVLHIFVLFCGAGRAGGRADLAHPLLQAHRHWQIKYDSAHLSTSPRPLRRRPALLLALAASGGRRCARLLALRLGRARARRARLLCGSAPLYTLRGRFSSRAHAAVRLLRCGPREPPHLEPVEGPGLLRLLRLAVAAAAAVVVAAAAATAARQRELALADGDGEVLLSRVERGGVRRAGVREPDGGRRVRRREIVPERRRRRGRRASENGAGVRRIACAGLRAPMCARRTRGRGRRATPTRRPSSRRKCGSRCAGWCRRRAAAAPTRRPSAARPKR